METIKTLLIPNHPSQTKLNSRASGSGCAGCAAVHPIIASFLSRDPSFGPKKLDFYTYMHTPFLEASIGSE